MLVINVLLFPTIILLTLVMGSGFALAFLPDCVAEAWRGTRDQWPAAFGFAALIIAANYLSWFGFRSARRAFTGARFLGISRQIWLLTIPTSWSTGLALGIYLMVERHG